MIKLIFTIAITLLVCQASKDWYRSRQADVITHLTIGSVMLKPNFTKIITFLRPQSFDSQGMTLVLEDYAHNLRTKGQNNVTFFEVNCVQENQLCRQMGVTQVPFIFVFNPDGMAEQQYPGGVFSHKQTLDMIMQTVEKINRGQFMKANQRHFMRIQHLKQLQSQSQFENAQQKQATTGNQLLNSQVNSPKSEQQLPSQTLNQRAIRKTSQTKKVRPQQIKGNQGPIFTSNQPISVPKVQITDLFKQPSQLNEKQIVMSQQARQKHQILLSNIQKSRQNRRKYFIIGSGSMVPILVIIAIILGVIYYIKSIVSKTSPLKKVISGQKSFYTKVHQEDEKITMK